MTVESDAGLAFPVDAPSAAPPMRSAVDVRHPDSRYHTTVAIPNDWEQLDSSPTETRTATDFAELARFGSTSQPVNHITIAVLELPRECGPAEWLDIDQKRRGHTILERRDLYSQLGSLPDVLTKHFDGNVAVISRTTVIKDGARLFRLECSASESEYPRLADSFLASVTTFQLLHASGERCAEPITAIPLGEGVQVAVPESWRLVEPPSQFFDTILNSSQGSLAEVKSEFNGQWTGTLLVARAAPRGRAAVELRRANLERLRARGVSFSRVNTSNVPSDSDSFSGQFFEPEISDAYEAPFLILVSIRNTFLIALIGPAPSAEPEWHAINKRAFEIARDSLTAPDQIDWANRSGP